MIDDRMSSRGETENTQIFCRYEILNKCICLVKMRELSCHSEEEKGDHNNLHYHQCFFADNGFRKGLDNCELPAKSQRQHLHPPIHLVAPRNKNQWLCTEPEEGDSHSNMKATQFKIWNTTARKCSCSRNENA